jgi:predicted AlkP superfamily pyrophosphatase or phosphodiesterase
MSPKYIKSIEEADVEIGKFIEKMKEEGLYESTHFMFLSDHGGINYGHGGMSENEMIVPWGITGPGIKKNYVLEEPNNTVNTASVILRLFKVEQPLSWTGEVPSSIFK